MAEALPLAFLAGVLSIITPCVLPLVPGYLSAVSAVEADRLGEAGVGGGGALEHPVHPRLRRCSSSSVRGSGARRRPRREPARRAGGLVLVILGLAFLGLLPWPERLVAPGLLTGAQARVRRSARRRLRGLRCPVHRHRARIGAGAGGRRGEILEGSAILAAYSAGLAMAFVLAAIAFVRAMGAFRWLRDHYNVIRVVSGSLLVLLGLAFFFHRDGWIRVAFDRALDAVELGV